MTAHLTNVLVKYIIGERGQACKSRVEAGTPPVSELMGGLPELLPAEEIPSQPVLEIVLPEDPFKSEGRLGVLRDEAFGTAEGSLVFVSKLSTSNTAKAQSECLLIMNYSDSQNVTTLGCSRKFSTIC